jgi:hypothetical protein
MTVEAASRVTPASVRAPGRSSERVIDLGILLGVTLLAILVRLPYLSDVPRYTDEVQEASVALGIVRGLALPLTNHDPYMGAFFNYVLAGLFAVFGTDPHLPRFLATAASVGTVALTCIWGRRLSDRWIGAIAALLVAGNAANILDSAHVGYSHSLTPFFATLGVWLFWEATDGRGLDRSRLPTRRLQLFGSALALGVAFQTHPTTIALLLGLAIVYLIRYARDRQLGIGSALGAVLGASVGCLNLLIFNVRSMGGGVIAGINHRWAYADQQPLTPRAIVHYWADGLRAFGSLVDGSAAAGGIMPRELELIFFGASVALCCSGTLLMLRHGQTFVPIVLGSWLVVLPILTTGRTTVDRFWMPSLPLAALAMAGAIVFLLRDLRARCRSGLGLSVAILVVAVLVAHSWPGLERLYQLRAAVQPTNSELEALVSAVSADARPRERVLVEQSLFAKPIQDETSEFRTIEYLLTLRGDAPPTRNDFREILLGLARPDAPASEVVVSTDRAVEQLAGLAQPEDLSPPIAPLRELSVAVTRLRPLGPPSVSEREGASSPLDVVFGDKLRLIGYRVGQSLLYCGDELPVTLYWTKAGPIDADYTIFNHLQLGDRTIGHQDSPPQNGRRPTTSWRDGEVVTDVYGIRIDGVCTTRMPIGFPSVAALQVGVYNASTMERLPITSGRVGRASDYVEFPTRVLAILPYD